MKLLLVEPDPEQRRSLRRELTDEGYDVLEATDGREAIGVARDERPALAVLALRLPVMDGLEAMGRMLAENNRLLIVIHTMDPNYRDDFRSWSADAVVDKSSDLTRLKTTVREILLTRRPLEQKHVPVGSAVACWDRGAGAPRPSYAVSGPAVSHHH